MGKSGNQTQTGKAFEYACAYALYSEYKADTKVTLVNSPQMTTAKNAYRCLQESEKRRYVQGAEAAVRIIGRLEPQLSKISTPMAISLQADRKGAEGDVRDVLCVRGSEWEIGLSCKHNYDTVKHSRLSDLIDFGEEWFGKKCSDTYFQEVKSVFTPLRKIRDDAVAQKKEVRWDDVYSDKESECYIPILDAFMKELKRLDAEYPNEIPGQLIRYLIGKNDFYKVIMNDRKCYTKIESVNINGSLNRSDGKRKALLDVPLMKLPTKFYEIGYKDNLKTTIVIVCDKGWNVSMRIHTASSQVQPSLKFDVQLIAMPSEILTQIEPWQEPLHIPGEEMIYDVMEHPMVAEEAPLYGTSADNSSK